VTKLHQTLEEGGSSLKLPEKMCQDLAMNQEKVAALQAYLTQEVDEANFSFLRR
jgi:hypothetical protein